MQKHRFIQYLIAGIFFISVWHFSSGAQTDADWKALYRQQEWAALQQLVQEGKITDPCWQTFLQALFIEKADSALQVLASLYFRCPDPEIRQGIRQRLYAYYYARGYYGQAQKIQQNDSLFHKMLALRATRVRYGVQLGAFRTYANALKLKQKWGTRIRPMQIINKIRNGRRLYIVVGGEFKKRAKAENFRQRLRHELGIEGYVIEF